MKRYQKTKGKAIATGMSVLIGILVTLYVGVSLGAGTWNPSEWVQSDQQVEQELPEQTESDN